MSDMKLALQVVRCKCGKFYDASGHKLMWAVRMPRLDHRGYRHCSESPHAATINGARALLKDCEAMQKEAELND